MAMSKMIISEIQNMQDYIETLDFVLKVYDENKEGYYQPMSTLEQASSHSYRYDDENICIENLRYDMNVTDNIKTESRFNNIYPILYS